MTHTAGPYEIVTADIGDEFACIVPVCINAANGRTVISDNGGLAPDDEEWHAEELFANAHLFAAAPDMLAALKHDLTILLETHPTPEQRRYALALTIAAIAKAEGVPYEQIGCDWNQLKYA